MKATNNKTVKYLILIPVFILFFITVKAISGKSSDRIEKKMALKNDDNTKIVIDKNTSDKDFSAIMSSLKEKGIIAAFKNIIRNEHNEITGIDIEVTKDGATSSYSAKSNMAINKIIIEIDGVQVSIHNEGLFSFGFSNDDEISKLMQQKEELLNNFSSQYGNDEMQKMMQQQQQFFQKFSRNSSVDELKKMIEQQQQIFNNYNSSDEEVNKNDLDESDFKFSEKEKSIYIVNGKEMSEDAYKKMDKSKIKTLEIKKEVIKSYHKKIK